MDQRNCIEICVRNEIKCAMTFQMLTVVFGVSIMSRTQVQLWYNRFKEGREDFNRKSMLVLIARARQQPMKTLKQ